VAARHHPGPRLRIRGGSASVGSASVAARHNPGPRLGIRGGSASLAATTISAMVSGACRDSRKSPISAGAYQCRMSDLLAAPSAVDLTRDALRPWLGNLIRRCRRQAGLSQEELAGQARTSSSTVARIESGRADHIDLAVVERIFAALGLRGTLTAEGRHMLDRVRQSDGVHARCNGYGARRLGPLGWIPRLEVRIGDIRPRGWIDLLGYRPADHALLVAETKAELPDMGGLQRSLAFYEREAPFVARRLGWTVRSVTVVVLALDSAAMARRLADNKDILATAFPGDVRMLDAWLRDPAAPRPTGWTIAMIDPASRSSHWLRPPALGTVRRRPAYEDYADAARGLLSG